LRFLLAQLGCFSRRGEAEARLVVRMSLLLAARLCI
jgi:hypothetical protein